ncbi:hypothetical protein [Palaeococcus ferrophilus]|uniref:hypothetical protein n=1 Tax=Palaeococcus ferrophilus TaxID=83868 RepID=UPI00064FA4CF|nr:hypothetical protein [Palaeococcus ferrophilus]
MKVGEALLRIFPEVPELENVDFSKYASQYVPLILAFADSGKTGLREFEGFVEAQTGSKDVVGNVLISVFQYIIIAYRRYGSYEVVVPALKLFMNLKGWLNKNGHEKEWQLLLHNFLGYLVTMMPPIAENEECGMANAYLTFIHALTLEARESFAEAYFEKLEASASTQLMALRERCGIEEKVPKEKRKGC